MSGQNEEMENFGWGRRSVEEQLRSGEDGLTSTERRKREVRMAAPVAVVDSISGLKLRGWSRFRGVSSSVVADGVVKKII